MRALIESVGVLVPAVVCVVGALLVLLVDAALPRARGWQRWVGLVTVLGSAVAIWWFQYRPAPGQTCVETSASAPCLYQVHTGTAVLGWLAVLGVGVALVLLSERRSRAPGGHTVAVSLALVSVAGVLSVLVSGDLLTLVVSLEVATVPLIALSALRGTGGASRAALSLLVTSMTSFALVVVGAALWVTVMGTALLAGSEVDQALDAAYADPARRAILVLAVLTLVAGIAFKVSLIPFHAWTPPTYREADLFLITLFVVPSKVAGLGAVLAVVRPFVESADAGAQGPGEIAQSIAAATLLSLLVGAAVAFRQVRALGFLAWSTIAQAGWILLPLPAMTPGAVRASIFYLVTYAVATVLVILTIDLVNRTRGEGGTWLTAYEGLIRTDPVTGAALALGLLVLAGLPPGMVGLIAKVVSLRALTDAGLWPVAAVAAVGVVVGIAAYVRWLSILVTARTGTGLGTAAPVGPRPRPRVVLALVLVLIVVLIALSVRPMLVLGLLG